MQAPRILTISDLCPDGVKVAVRWDKMQIGASIFVPCINTVLARKQAKVIFNRFGWGLHAERRIEGGKYGLRIWRTI
jgi:hypothetical protein